MNLRDLGPRLLFIEVIALTLLFVGFGFLFNKTDPLYLNTPYSPIQLLVLVFTLYYGILHGVITFIFIILLSSILYSLSDISLISLGWNLVIVLTAGEFKYYWHKRIDEIEKERIYYEEHINSLRRSYYILKLSHEQLENNFILRPFSMRQLFEELRKKLLITKDEHEIMSFLLNILVQNFNVYRAEIYKGNIDKGFTIIASTDNDLNKKLDMNNTVVKDAIEEENTHYISPKLATKFLSQNNEDPVLAVVFTKAYDADYLVVIKDIPFINLNSETLNYIYILLKYIVDDFEVIRNVDIDTHICDIDFIKELYKMYKLHSEFGTESSVVIFNTKTYHTKEIKEKIEHLVRPLDRICILNDKKIAILLPLTKRTGAESFINRILTSIDLETIDIIKVTKDPKSIMETIEQSK